MNKNWVTVPRTKVDEALEWAKNSSMYITNDYGVIGGRTEHYEKGKCPDTFDFFFSVSKDMVKFKKLFGVE
jgi:aryl-phospho-beta-D-glucosidase BglC (GH1 family)